MPDSIAPDGLMQALVVTQLGWPNTMRVEGHPIPEVSDETVLVRVRAAGLNFADTLLIGGTYQEKQAVPFVPGAELAGEVVACGASVQGVRIGDRVMGQVSSGAYAEYAAVHMHRLAPLPETMPYEMAAGFYIPYGTALCALRDRGRLLEGETLLVLGAAGAVGLAAIEVGKALGARVIGVSRSPHKRAAVLAAGADHFIADNGADLKDAVNSVTGGQGVDVVLDVVGGPAALSAMRCLRFEGRLVVVGFTSGEAPLFRANHVLVKNIDIVGCYWGPYQTLRPEATRKAFEVLLGWYGDGRLQPRIADRVGLGQVSQALEQLLAGKYAGKVIVDIGHKAGDIT